MMDYSFKREEDEFGFGSDWGVECQSKETNDRAWDRSSTEIRKDGSISKLIRVTQDLSKV